MKDTEIIAAALNSGFMLQSNYGQETSQLMPVSDPKTLITFARAIEKHLLGDKK